MRELLDNGLVDPGKYPDVDPGVVESMVNDSIRQYFPDYWQARKKLRRDWRLR